MTKALLLLIGGMLVVAENTYCQHLKIDNGISFTSFSGSNAGSVLNASHRAYTGLLGMDFLEHNWYYLSSQIGYESLGGADRRTLLVNGVRYYPERKQMIHLNTTFRAFLKSDNYRVFAGVGPYLNAGFGVQEFRNLTFYPYKYKQTNAGAKLELGITRDINRVRLGVLGTYMHGLSPAATGENVSIRNNGLTAQLTVGYHVGRRPYNRYRSNQGLIR